MFFWGDFTSMFFSCDFISRARSFLFQPNGLSYSGWNIDAEFPKLNMLNLKHSAIPVGKGIGFQARKDIQESYFQVKLD